jgi:hypothetical protein
MLTSLCASVFRGIEKISIRHGPGGLASREIAATAIHPGTPAHVEDAELELHPGCPACLLQIHPGTALGRLPASPSLLERGDELATLAEQVPFRETTLRGPARAPPALSPSV